MYLGIVCGSYIVDAVAAYTQALTNPVNSVRLNQGHCPSRALTWNETSNGSARIQLVLPPEIAQAFLNSVEPVDPADYSRVYNSDSTLIHTDHYSTTRCSEAIPQGYCRKKTHSHAQGYAQGHVPAFIYIEQSFYVIKIGSTLRLS